MIRQQQEQSLITNMQHSTLQQRSNSSQSEPIKVESFNSFQINERKTFGVHVLSSIDFNNVLVSIKNSQQAPIKYDLKLLKQNLQHQRQQFEYNEYQVSFVASTVDAYTIKVEMAQADANFCSQFLAKAYDLSKVSIKNSSGCCYVNESYEFEVDASEAGQGQLEIAVNEGEIPNQVQVLDNGRCLVNFVPEELTHHTVDIKFNGHNVIGCPFVVDVKRIGEPFNSPIFNPNLNDKIVLVKDENIPINSTTCVTLENFDQSIALNKDDIIITDPLGQLFNSFSIDRIESSVKFCFEPSIVGDYTIELKTSSRIEEHLQKSLIASSFPLTLKVFDINQVFVSDLSDGVINQPVYFFIDASRAGGGNLEIRVASKARNLPNHPQTEANARIRVSFVPTEPEEHIIDINFNGISVPNSPFLIKVFRECNASLSTEAEKALKFVSINKQVTFNADYLANVTDNLVANDCRGYILDPDFNYIKFKSIKLIKSSSSKQFVVDFTLSRVGPHKLFVFVKNIIIPSSPFICNAYNINEVIVTFDSANLMTKNSKISDEKDHQVGIFNKPFSFNVDASRAGEGTLALSVISNETGNPVQANINVSEKGQGLYNLTFVPTELAPHSIDMSFNDQPLPKSPFHIEILNEDSNYSTNGYTISESNLKSNNEQFINNKSSDNSNIRNGISKKQSNEPRQATAELNKSLAHGLIKVTNVVYLETGILEDSDYIIIINGPSNEKVPFKLVRENQQAYLEYKPKSIGTHEIIVSSSESNVSKSYIVEIFDPSNIRLINSDNSKAHLVGKPVVLTLDSREAGKIQLDSVAITGPNNFDKKIKESETSLINRLKTMSVSSSTNENDNSETSAYKNLTVNKTNDYTHSIEFTPKVAGKFSVDVKCLSQPIANCPFIVEVRELGSSNGSSGVEDRAIQATSKQQNNKHQAHQAAQKNDTLQSIVVHGLSLKCAPVNSTGALIIETNKLAVARDFDVLISDPQNCLVDVRCYLREDGNLLAEWTPRRVGTHQIEVLHKGLQVPGSPFKSEAFDPSQVILGKIDSKLCKVNEKVEFELNRKNAGYAELDVTIVSPLGKDLPIDVKPIDDDETGEIVSFVPRVAGKYKISIAFGGYEIRKSPIKFIVVGDEGLPDVRIAGTGLNYAEVNKLAQFMIEADYDKHELRASVSSDGKELSHKIEKCNSSYVVKYKPIKTGFVIIDLFIDEVRYYKFPYKVPVIDFSKLSFVSGTSKLVVPSKASSSNNQQRVCSFDVGKPVEFDVDTSECGPGELVAEIYCRANANLKFRPPTLKTQQHLYTVTFTCPPSHKMLADSALNVNDFSPKATYIVRFYYCNILVPETQACVVIEPTASKSSQNGSSKTSRNGDHHNALTTSDIENNNSTTNVSSSSKNKQDTTTSDSIHHPTSQQNLRSREMFNSAVVALRGHGLVEARCGEEAEFTIDGGEIGKGKPDVSMSIDDKSVPVTLTKISSKVYKAVYIPKVSGVHLLNVCWDGKQVAGCPISVNVLPLCDANKVVCTGEGLSGGVYGDEIKTFIDTRKAGPGELTACCDGPNKVAFCELLDRGDGTFILYVKPQEPGKHQLTIKYGGIHIPNSPFLVRVAGKPDPSKVRVYGPGIQHGILSTYQSKFMCDTRGAGAGQLTVRISGPRGAFRMETQREGQRERTILCRYDPTEPGDYNIEINWSGQQVPGSPFHVMIFDTHEELARYTSRSAYMKGQYNC